MGSVFLFARVAFSAKVVFLHVCFCFFCKGLSFFFLAKGLICFSHGKFFSKKKFASFFFFVFFFAEGGDVCFSQRVLFCFF